jgi:hypothetical protein
MDQTEAARWRPMASAPRDGTRILVAVSASEQGPAEVDVVRWAKPDRNGEECWVATDSDAESPVAYAPAELSSWMPLPTPLPRLRSTGRSDPGEADGSAI